MEREEALSKRNILPVGDPDNPGFFIDGEQHHYCQLWQANTRRDKAHNLHDRHKRKMPMENDSKLNDNTSNTDIMVLIGLLVIILIPYTLAVIKRGFCKKKATHDEDNLRRRRKKKHGIKKRNEDNKILEIDTRRRKSPGIGSHHHHHHYQLEELDRTTSQEQKSNHELGSTKSSSSHRNSRNSRDNRNSHAPFGLTNQSVMKSNTKSALLKGLILTNTDSYILTRKYGYNYNHYLVPNSDLKTVTNSKLKHAITKEGDLILNMETFDGSGDFCGGGIYTNLN